MNNSPITSTATGRSSCVGRITAVAAGGVAEGYSKAYGVELHCSHTDGFACIYIPVSWGCGNQNSLQRCVGQGDLLTVSAQSEQTHFSQDLGFLPGTHKAKCGRRTHFQGFFCFVSLTLSLLVRTVKNVLQPLDLHSPGAADSIAALPTASKTLCQGGERYVTRWALIFTAEEQLFANGFGEVLYWPGSRDKVGRKEICFRCLLLFSF